MIRRISITAFIGAFLVVGAIATSLIAAPVSAAKAPKADVCHYQAEDELLLDEFGEPVLDENGDEIVESPLGWRIINISGKALNAHVDNHNDGSVADFEIDDTDEDEMNDSEDCMALESFIDEDDEEV